jgi:hypothetical protein
MSRVTDSYKLAAIIIQRRLCHDALWLKLIMALLPFAVMATPAAHAQFLYRQLSLAQLTQRAAIIVQGHVTEVRYEALPDYPNINTVVVTLQVAESLKGSAGETYTFREFVSPGQSRMVRQGKYLVGHQLVLFLSAPSQYGLSSPLGRQQGTFHISEDSKGIKYVANEGGNYRLFAGVSQAATNAGAALSESPEELEALEHGPVPLGKFVSIVKELRAIREVE